MSNHCYTNITINHEDTNRLKTLYNLIEEWTSKNYRENGFGLSWLGNVVGNSGIDSSDENKDFSVRCRGSIIYMDFNGDQIIIDTETAWVPMMKMWIKVLEKYLPDAELIYSAEEPGCGIFWTNDPCIIGKYLIDSWNNDIEPNWEASKEFVISELQKLFKTDETNVKILIDMLNNSDVDVAVHKWKYVSEYDLE